MYERLIEWCKNKIEDPRFCEEDKEKLWELSGLIHELEIITSKYKKAETLLTLTEQVLREIDPHPLWKISSMIRDLKSEYSNFGGLRNG